MNKKVITMLPVISGIMWGATGPFVRYFSSVGLENMTLIAIRMLLASCMMFLGILMYDRSLLKIRMKDIWIFPIGGVIGMFGLNLAYNIAIQYLTLSLAAVLLSMSVIFVLIFAAILFHEKITTKKVFSMCLALIGCILVSGMLESDSGLQWTPFGIFLGLLAAMLYALYSLVSKAAMKRNYHPVTITFFCMLSGAVILTFFSNWSNFISVMSEKPSINIFLIFLHAICASVCPYLLFTLSLQYMDAGKASILAAVEPVAAMVFGAVLYAEMPTILSIVGLICALFAIAIISLSKE